MKRFLPRNAPIFFLLIAVAFFSSCNTNNHSFTVDGNIEGMPVQLVSLVTLDTNDNLIVLDSTRSDDKGQFTLKGRGDEPAIYQVKFGEEQERFIMLSMDNGKAEIKGKWEFLQENYTVAGSPGSSSLRTLLQVMREHMSDMYTYGMVMDSAKAKGNDSMLVSAQTQMQKVQDDLGTYVKSYADTTKYLPNALFGIRLLNPRAGDPYIAGFVSKLETRFPNSAYAGAFIRKFKDMEAGMNNAAAAEQDNSGGIAAKEITQPTPDGKMVSLSSFKGKYVLIDFWASWCGPCRAENPNVVAAYNTFKDKNFTILGVSLDQDKDKWVEAIKKDKLTWTHVSDLKGWESIPARDYSVQSIPANFLIDPNGKIIGSDLRGPALEAKLAEVLNTAPEPAI